MTTQERIERYMERHSMSQEAFARRAGIAQNSVSVMLRGKKPGIALAFKVAAVLGVKPETLMK